MVCEHCGLEIWRDPSASAGSMYKMRDKGDNICPKDGLWHKPKGVRMSETR